MASQVDVAPFSGVSLSFCREVAATVSPHFGGWNSTGNRRGGPVQIDAASCAPMQHWLHERHDLTLAKLAGRRHAQYGLCVSISCVWRPCSGSTCVEKNTIDACDRASPHVLLARQQYRTLLAPCFVLIASYGRARRGMQVHEQYRRTSGATPSFGER
jgi:hypothetical protein